MNVVRHAQVETAQVRLRETDRELLIDVIDEGIGFDPAEREAKTITDSGELPTGSNA